MRNRLRKGGVFVFCVVLSTIGSLVVAQTPASRVGVLTVSGGQGATEIRIAEWEAGIPRLLEIRSEEAGKTIFREVDPSLIAAASWDAHEEQSDGWVRGTLTVPSAGALGTTYDLAYRELRNDLVEYRLQQEGDYGNEIVGIMPISNPIDGSDKPAFVIVIPVIVAIALISGCYYAQVSAIRSCVGHAGQSCVAGTYLKSARFRGACGTGECTIECMPLPTGGD